MFEKKKSPHRENSGGGAIILEAAESVTDYFGICRSEVIGEDEIVGFATEFASGEGDFAINDNQNIVFGVGEIVDGAI